MKVLDGTGEEPCILMSSLQRVTAKTILQAMNYLEDAFMEILKINEAISKTSDEKE